MQNDSYTEDDYSGDDFGMGSDYGLPDISGASNPDRTGTTYDQQQALSSPIVMPPLKRNFVSSGMVDSETGLPSGGSYRDSQGGIYPRLPPPITWDTGRTIDPNNLPPELKPVGQTLAEKVAVDGAYTDPTRYMADVRGEAYKLAKAMGIDITTPKGASWIDKTLEAAQAKANQYVIQPNAKNLIKLKDPFGGEVAIDPQTGKQFSAELKIPGLNLGTSDVTPSEKFAKVEAMHEQVLQNPALAKLPVFQQNEKLYLQHSKEEAAKAKGELTKEDLGSLSGDVKDILEGRNSAYNIRQEMGRSDKTRQYMTAIRSEIRKVDPTFDFAASDAGTKSLSSAHIQKSMSAVNAVLPNIDRMIEMSKDIDRIGVKGIDELIQKGQVQFGNKKVSNFRQARKLLADEVGAALGAGSASDMKLQLGFDVTDTSVPDEVFASNMETIRDFLNNRKAGLNSLRYVSSKAGGSSDQGEMVKVTKPDGTLGSIPKSRLADALKAGYKTK